MKVVISLFVLVIICVIQSKSKTQNVLKEKVTEKNNSVLQAIVELFKVFHVNNDFVREVEIVCFECKLNESFTMIDKIIKSGQKADNLPIRVAKAGEKTPWNYQLNSSSILIFESYENYKKYVDKIIWKPRLSSNLPYHIIYIRTQGKENWEIDIKKYYTEHVNYIFDGIVFGRSEYKNFVYL
jgi:hypothetical protein